MEISEENETSEKETNEIFFGVVETPEEDIERLEVVTDRYIREGYLQGMPFANVDLEAKDVVGDNGFDLLYNALDDEVFEKFMEEGLLLRFVDNKQIYLDKYHWQSIRFLAKNNNECVGSVRLIIDNHSLDANHFPLPTLSDKDIHIDPQWQENVKSIKAELSQFAKAKGPNAPATVSVGLLRAAAQYSRLHGIEEWLATTDNSVVKLLNSFLFNFDLPKIGPSVKYLGSESTPVYINIGDCIKNAEKKESTKNMALFLRGYNNIPGFEWYKGI